MWVCATRIEHIIRCKSTVQVRVGTEMQPLFVTFLCFVASPLPLFPPSRRASGTLVGVQVDATDHCYLRYGPRPPSKGPWIPQSDRCCCFFPSFHRSNPVPGYSSGVAFCALPTVSLARCTESSTRRLLCLVRRGAPLVEKVSFGFFVFGWASTWAAVPTSVLNQLVFLLAENQVDSTHRVVVGIQFSPHSSCGEAVANGLPGGSWAQHW